MKWHIAGSPCTGELVCSADDWSSRIASDRCGRCAAWSKRQPGIRIKYTSVDRARVTRRFKTLEAARRFAQRRIGEHPEIGSSRYAVSGDGVGKITVGGCTLAELFPEEDEERPTPGLIGVPTLCAHCGGTAVDETPHEDWCLAVDPTEGIRRAMLAAKVPEADLAKAEKRWDSDALREEFEVLGFMAPFVVVRRKSDGQKGSLEFTHSPRFYFNWQEDVGQ